MWARDFVGDARFAARQFRREPLVGTAVVLTLALGIGATSAMFTVVHGVLLRPLPFPEPDRLVAIAGLSYRGEFLHVREHARTLDPAAYTEPGDVSVTGGVEPLRLAAASVSPEVFSVLGIAPVLGRAFDEPDARPGGESVVLLSAGFWRAHFGGDPAVIGRRLIVEGTARTVVGIMPAAFAFPSPRVQIWTPLVIDAANPIALWASSARMVARLRPGASVERAAAELRTMVPRLKASFPWQMHAAYGQQVDAVPLSERTVGEVRPMLLLLLGAVAAVLVVVCTNVANLLLARSASRQRELAIRLSLGAGRGRLVRQMLAESVAVSVVAGAFGAGLAYAGLEGLVARTCARGHSPVRAGCGRPSMTKTVPNAEPPNGTALPAAALWTPGSSRTLVSTSLTKARRRSSSGYRNWGGAIVAVTRRSALKPGSEARRF